MEKAEGAAKLKEMQVAEVQCRMGTRGRSGKQT